MGRIKDVWHFLFSKPKEEKECIVELALSEEVAIDHLITEIDAEDVLLDLEDLDESTIPDYDQLTPAQQVMKSEEDALRERLRETAKTILSDEFDDMEDVDAYLLLRQFVGMTLYHSSLITRMEDIIQFKS